MILRLGVTGGIGSGKSTVCKIFRVLGIPVFSSDEEGRVIMDTDRELRKELNKLVGEDLYATGKLDRNRLASIIFNDKFMLNSVNSLVHPLVLSKYRDWCKQQSADYVIFEAAILFEAGAEKHVDKILTVTAPLEERINRVMDRNLMNRNQVIERVKNQLPEEEMVKRSDYVIDNSENVMIIPQVMKLHNTLLRDLKK